MTCWTPKVPLTIFIISIVTWEVWRCDHAALAYISTSTAGCRWNNGTRIIYNYVLVTFQGKEWYSEKWRWKMNWTPSRKYYFLWIPMWTLVLFFHKLIMNGFFSGLWNTVAQWMIKTALQWIAWIKTCFINTVYELIQPNKLKLIMNTFFKKRINAK